MFFNCSNPWTQMILCPSYSATGDDCASPCCHFRSPLIQEASRLLVNVSKEDSIGDVWNSPLFTGLRGNIAQNNPVFEPCKKCFAVEANGNGVIREPTVFSDESCVENFIENRYSHPDSLPLASRMRFAGINPEYIITDKSFFNALSLSQQKNMHAAQRSLENRDVRLDSMPLSYLMRFGYKCNLRCVMCNHEEMCDNRIYNNREPGELDTGWLKTQEEYFAKSLIVTVTGGEPLFMKSSTQFILWFLQNEALGNTELRINTNAMLLERFIPQFDNANVTLTVSIDSYGERYEKIRIGSSWKTVTGNIDAFLKSKNEIAPHNRLVNIYCTITRTGLPGIPNLVRWAMDRGLGMDFTLVENWNEAARAENLLETPERLADIPRWQRYFDEAIGLLEKNASDRYAAEHLTVLRDKVSKFTKFTAVRGKNNLSGGH